MGIDRPHRQPFGWSAGGFIRGFPSGTQKWGFSRRLARGPSTDHFGLLAEEMAFESIQNGQSIHEDCFAACGPSVLWSLSASRWMYRDSGVIAMNCSEIQEQLSAYHDGELNDEIRVVVAAHVVDCLSCAGQLAAIESFAGMFALLPRPEAPRSVWDGVAAGLNQPAGETAVVAVRGDRSWISAGRLAMAASVLLVLGFSFWLTRQPDPTPSGHSSDFVMVMDHYLKALSADPDAAERFLLAKYNGQTVDPEDAIELVGYRPAVASGLPEQYTLTSTSVMKMPCCTCVKAVCKRKDGSTLVLFEHDDRVTDWFGKRASSMATCGDTECCLVELASSIAATWKHGPRWVTAVGARDADEVSELVTWLQSNSTS